MFKKFIYFIPSIIIFFVFVGSGCSYNSINKNLNDTNITNGTSIQVNKKDKMSGDSNTLNLSYQNINKVPEYIFKSVKLLELNLSNNNLTGTIPAEIRQLKNLKNLNLSNNQMTGVPAEVGQLTNLEILNLSNNKLTGLPYELGNLKKLRILDLRGNNYSIADLEVIKKGLSNSVEIKK